MRKFLNLVESIIMQFYKSFQRTRTQSNSFSNYLPNKPGYHKYLSGLEDWQKLNSDITWANYLAFLESSWYQDGLMAWRNTAWRENKTLRSRYEKIVNDIGFDYKIELRTHVLLWFAESVSNVEGCFVEFGTG
jgi:hypothetical protein